MNYTWIAGLAAGVALVIGFVEYVKYKYSGTVSRIGLFYAVLIIACAAAMNLLVLLL